MYNNENVLAEAECKPKVAGGAIAAWVIAALIMLPALFDLSDPELIYLIIGLGFFAFFPAIIGLCVQLSMLSTAKNTVLVATERCIYCKCKNVRSYGGGLVEVPYESIINIKVAPEGLSRMNGDMLSLYLPSGMLSFRFITNAPQVVMSIKNKVETIKGPMPPFGYGMMRPVYVQAPMGYAPPYGQPVYGQPMQQGYGQPYGQPQYAQPPMPPYGQPNYQPVQPSYAPPPQSPYQPVRPEYQQPAQNVYPNQPAAQPEYVQPTAQSGMIETEKQPEIFDIPEDNTPQ